MRSDDVTGQLSKLILNFLDFNFYYFFVGCFLFVLGYYRKMLEKLFYRLLVNEQTLYKTIFII